MAYVNQQRQAAHKIPLSGILVSGKGRFFKPQGVPLSWAGL